MIKGKLISLRSMEAEDISIIAEWNFDPDISRYFPSRFPNNLNEQKIWFEKQINQSGKKKLIITENASGEPVGMIGILNIDHINKNCEIGITIGKPTEWGKGVAKEAASMTLELLFGDFNMHIIYALIFEENTRAVRFFTNLGFVQEGILKDRIFKNKQYNSIVVVSLKKDDYYK